MENKIESYLNGELSAVEKMDFEKKITTSPELQNDVEQMRILIGALNRKKMSSTILAAEKFNFRQKIWKIGLLCLFLGVAGFFISDYFSEKKVEIPAVPSKTESPKLPEPTVPLPKTAPNLPTESPKITPKVNREIAQAPVKKSPDAPVFRSLPDAEKMSAEAIFLADDYLPTFSPISYPNLANLTTVWNAGNFESYYIGVENLIQKNGSTNSEFELLRAACLLRLHRPVAAAQILFPLLEAAEPVKSDAAWLLVLGFVMQGKDDSARVALASIKGKYMISAKLLLAKIDE
jgi:hypothetical protein